MKALTGIDCDRWEEEKNRGITIDLGFAHLEDDDLQLGFVDVPGHERFVHNALAGLGGIDLMVLVVAADEGIMPQTREHLAICSLLEIPAGLVALTKIDLVDPDLLDLATLELTEALEGSSFEGVPIVRVSSTRGDGVSELKETLLQLAREVERPLDRGLRPSRLPIDRAFHLRGLGVLVTGTLVAGRIRPQSHLELLPSGGQVRVRSVQVHGVDRDQAEAGERTALQLSGASLEQVDRGAQLVTSSSYCTTTSLLAHMRLLDDAPQTINGFREVRFHLYSGEVLGKLRPLAPTELVPGASAAVEIRLLAPVVAARGDRFVVRRPSPQTTLGGGTILDPEWARYRGPKLSAALESLQKGSDEAILFWVRAAGEAGVAAATLARRLGTPEADVAATLAAAHGKGSLLHTPPRGREPMWISAAAYSKVSRRAKSVLHSYFKKERLASGMPKAEAVRRILPPAALPLAEVYLDWLQSHGVLTIHQDMVNLPGRGEELTTEESQLAERILQRLDEGGLTPPSPQEICAALGAKKSIFDGVLRYLHQRKRIARLPQGLFLAQSQLDRLGGDLANSDWTRFTVGEFKARFGLTRKWAIPLLEHLDQTGQTRRDGDAREVIRK